MTAPIANLEPQENMELACFPSTSPSGAQHTPRFGRRLGILALTVDENVTFILQGLRRMFGVPVASIPVEFAALNPGLLAGEVIYEMDGARLDSFEKLRAGLDSKRRGAPIALLIERSGQLRYVSFELE